MRSASRFALAIGIMLTAQACSRPSPEEALKQADTPEAAEEAAQAVAKLPAEQGVRILTDDITRREADFTVVARRLKRSGGLCPTAGWEIDRSCGKMYEDNLRFDRQVISTEVAVLAGISPDNARATLKAMAKSDNGTIRHFAVDMATGLKDKRALEDIATDNTFGADARNWAQEGLSKMAARPQATAVSIGP